MLTGMCVRLFGFTSLMAAVSFFPWTKVERWSPDFFGLVLLAIFLAHCQIVTEKLHARVVKLEKKLDIYEG